MSISAIVWGIFILCVMIGSILIDLLMRTYFPTRRTLARRIIGTCSMLPSLIIFAILAAYPNLSGHTVIGLIVTAYGPLAWCILVRDPVLVDMAPKMSGTLYGITDLFYSAGGFAVPIICDALVNDYAVGSQWRPVWICIIGCNVAWIILYVGFCKSEEADFSVKL